MNHSIWYFRPPPPLPTGMTFVKVRQWKLCANISTVLVNSPAPAPILTAKRFPTDPVRRAAAVVDGCSPRACNAPAYRGQAVEELALRRRSLNRRRCGYRSSSSNPQTSATRHCPGWSRDKNGVIFREMPLARADGDGPGASVMSPAGWPRHRGTVYREIAKTVAWMYRPDSADRMAWVRKLCGSKIQRSHPAFAITSVTASPWDEHAVSADSSRYRGDRALPHEVEIAR